MTKESRQKSRLSRRNVLKSVGAGSTLLIGLRTSPNIVGAEGNKVKIVTLAEGDRAAKTEWVSKKWYNHTKKAREAKRTIRTALTSRSDVHAIGIGKGDRRIGNLLSHTIDVQVTENGTVSDIPDTVNSIPVVIQKSQRDQPACYTGYQDPIHGGIGCYSGEGWYGTLCSRVYKDGIKYMLCCRHLFTSDGTNCSNENVIGKNWYQGGGDLVGNVEYAYQHHDITLLENQYTDRTFTNDIADETGNVVGRVTGNGLEYLKSNNSTVQKRGRTTCRESGQIKAIKQEIFCFNGNYIGGVVRSSPNMKDGDSGGPVYYEEYGTPDKLYIVNIATHSSTDGTYDTTGSSANSMTKKQGITWGGNPYSG